MLDAYSRGVSTLLEILELRFIHRSASALVLFQPFLRFWAEGGAEVRSGDVLRVSTLLEILGLVCLVVVGFYVFLWFFVGSAVGLMLRFTFISRGVE